MAAKVTDSPHFILNAYTTLPTKVQRSLGFLHIRVHVELHSSVYRKSFN